MKVFKDLKEWQAFRKTLDNWKLGFVPTMGALHEGHASLLRRSHSENDVSVLSIYVNPTQFDNKGDLENYPATWQQDLELAEQLNVDYLIAPTYEQLYPDNYRYQINENELSSQFCGAHRQGHFTGVLTVVMKLLNLVKPHRAYFGEKDYQQYLLVRDMCQSFFLETEIIACPTVRETDGLAMSSRNSRLNFSERKKAPHFHELLQQKKSDTEIIEELKGHGFDVDYVESLDRRRLAAIQIGDVRLIDNVEI